MFSAYKVMLKRNEELDWMSRHDLELSSATPLIARGFCKTHGMPLCGAMEEHGEENYTLIGACATESFSNVDDLMQIVSLTLALVSTFSLGFPAPLSSVLHN